MADWPLWRGLPLGIKVRPGSQTLGGWPESLLRIVLPLKVLLCEVQLLKLMLMLLIQEVGHHCNRRLRIWIILRTPWRYTSSHADGGKVAKVDLLSTILQSNVSSYPQMLQCRVGRDTPADIQTRSLLAPFNPRSSSWQHLFATSGQMRLTQLSFLYDYDFQFSLWDPSVGEFQIPVGAQHSYRREHGHLSLVPRPVACLRLCLGGRQPAKSMPSWMLLRLFEIAQHVCLSSRAYYSSPCMHAEY